MVDRVSTLKFNNVSILKLKISNGSVDIKMSW